MSAGFHWFEAIVRAAHRLEQSGPSRVDDEKLSHPFDTRNIHPDIAKASKRLFDDGHYSQATFEAFKFLERTVSSMSGLHETGYKLMMSAFNENNPKIKLTPLATTSEVDEQRGFQYMFAGSSTGIRNPRGHEVSLSDPIDMCLDHLSVASVLLRRIENRIAP